ncbi:MAG: nicotinamide-nucleotide adenylyltransferase [Candidatus Thorarchaeota archaeon]
MSSIFIGRFQPVHKGHIHTIRQILDKGENLIIAVGSAQYSHTPDNPLTGGERVMLLRQAIIDDDLPLDRIQIVPVPDINIHPIWAAHLKSLVPYFDKAYSHNPLVQRLLRDAGFRVEETSLHDRDSYNAKHIRELILAGSSDWEPLLSSGVIKLMKKHKMVERMREIGQIRTKR